MLRGWTAVNDDQDTTPNEHTTGSSSAAKDGTAQQSLEDKSNGSQPTEKEAHRSGGEKTARDIGESLEVQEAQANKMYSDALGLLRSHGPGSREWEECKSLFEQVLDMRIVETCTLQDQYSLVPRIKYCCLRNLASMLDAENEPASALRLYFDALDIDDTDVSVWLAASRAARKTGESRVEQVALEKVTLLDPEYLPAISRLIELAFVTGNEPLFNRVTTAGKALHDGPVVQATLLQRALQIYKQNGAVTWPARFASAFPEGQLYHAKQLVLQRSKRLTQARGMEELQSEGTNDRRSVTLELSSLKYEFVLRKVLALCRNEEVGHGRILLKFTGAKAEECNGEPMEIERKMPQKENGLSSCSTPKQDGNVDAEVKRKADRSRKVNQGAATSAQEKTRIHNKSASRFVSSALVAIVDPNLTLCSVELLSRSPEHVLSSLAEDTPLDGLNGKSQDKTGSLLPLPESKHVLRVELTLDQLERNKGKVDLLEWLLLHGRAFDIDSECKKLFTRAVGWLTADTQGRLLGKPESKGLVRQDDWEGLLFVTEVVVDYAATSSEKVRKDLCQLCSFLMRRLVIFGTMLLQREALSSNSDQGSLCVRTYWLMQKFADTFNVRSNNTRTVSLLHQCRDAFAKTSQHAISLPHCSQGNYIDAETLNERIGGVQAKATLDSLRSALSKEANDPESLSRVLRELEERYVSQSDGIWCLSETWKEFAGFPSTDASVELDWLKQQENASPLVAFHILSLNNGKHDSFVVLAFLVLQALCKRCLTTEDGEKYLTLFVQVSTRVSHTLGKAQMDLNPSFGKLLDAEQFIETGFEVASVLGDQDSTRCLEAVGVIALYFNQASFFQRRAALNLSVNVTKLDYALDAKYIKARSGLATDVLKYSQFVSAVLHVWVQFCESTRTNQTPLGDLTLNTLLNPLLRLVYMINYAISKNAGKEPTWTKGLCGNAMVVAAWLVLVYECRQYKTYGKLICTLRVALESQCSRRESIEKLARLTTAELSKREVVLWVNQQEDRELSEDLETFRQEAMNQSYYCLYGLQDAAGGCRLWEYLSITCDPTYPKTKDGVNAYFTYLLPYLEGVTAYSSGFEHHEYMIELLRNSLDVIKDERVQGPFSRSVEEQGDILEIFDVDEKFFTAIETSRVQLDAQHAATTSSAETLSRIHFILAEAMSQIRTVKPKSRKRGASENDDTAVTNHEPLIKLYQADLTFNPWRIHSWFQYGLLVRDQMLSDQTAPRFIARIIANWFSSDNDSALSSSIQECGALYRRLKLCLRAWFIVTHLVKQDAKGSTSEESLNELRQRHILPLFTRVFCSIRAYQETDVPAKATVTRVNDDGTYDLTNEDDPGMEFHVNREWIEPREPWSQLTTQNANKFLGECYEIIGNTIYSNLFVIKHQDEKYRRLLEHAKGFFEKFESQHPKETHVATFMKARILRKMGTPVQVYLPLFVDSLKRLEAIGRKDGLGSGKLCREKVLYQIHSSLSKILLRREQLTEDTLAFLETVMFQQLRVQKQANAATVARQVVSECVFKVCQRDRDERVMNLLLSSLSQLEEISTWNYQAVFRRGWIIWQASIRFPQAKGSFNHQKALSVLLELVKKRPKIKGVNLIWNRKYVDFTEHMVRPAHRYHLVRFKVIKTILNVCEAEQDCAKAQDLVEVILSQPSDPSMAMLQAECLKSLIKMMRTAAGRETGSLSNWLDKAFKIYVHAAQLTDKDSDEKDASTEAVAKLASQLLVDLYTKHRGTTSSTREVQATLQMAINFCDRTSPNVRGKKKLSKAKLRLKKKRKTEEFKGQE